jgi:hypothetical protein
MTNRNNTQMKIPLTVFVFLVLLPTVGMAINPSGNGVEEQCRVRGELWKRSYRVEKGSCYITDRFGKEHVLYLGVLSSPSYRRGETFETHAMFGRPRIHDGGSGPLTINVRDF